MNQLRTVPRAVWLVFSLGLILAGASWFAATKYRPVAVDSGDELATLTAEREQLRGNEDGVRDALHHKCDALRGQAWSGVSRASLPAQLGNGWAWEWTGSDRALLRRVNPQIEDWPEYVTVVQQLGGRPGLMVDSFEVRADGVARSRRFAAVSIGLRFIVSDAPVGDAMRAAPSRAPHPVAPADGPALTRKVGPVPALRQPSASFRPDPQGSSAGIPPNQNPQDKSP